MTNQTSFHTLPVLVALVLILISVWGVQQAFGWLFYTPHCMNMLSSQHPELSNVMDLVEYNRSGRSGSFASCRFEDSAGQSFLLELAANQQPGWISMLELGLTVLLVVSIGACGSLVAIRKTN
jgi:hypothetical protein